MRQRRFLGLGAAALVACVFVSGAALSDPSSEIKQLDLAKPFSTKSAWRMTVTHGPAGKDVADNPAPGALSLCLEKSADGPCSNELMPTGKAVQDWEPHYLNAAEVVYPQGPRGAPLLLISTASIFSGDGDQLAVTELFRYDAGADKFERVFSRNTGRNNNQEVRFIESGPLRGDVIFVEPTEKAPFGYRVEIDKPTAHGVYKQAIRFRSATRYGDGNPLGVIDSEMPNIEQHLGVRKPGAPLPLPGGHACAKPHLKAGALWCQ